MPDPIRIEWTTRGVADVLRDTKRVGDAIKQTPTPKPIKPPRFISGPNQRFALLNSQMQSALKMGNEAAIKDIGAALDRTRKQLEPKRKGGISSRLNTFARSTRFGAEGAMPLIGQTADLLGAGEAGPFGLLAVGAISAGKALKEFSDDARQAAMEFSQQRYRLGGSDVANGKLNALGGGMEGVDLKTGASQLAGMDYTNVNGYQLQALNQLGIKNLTPQGLRGAQDPADKELQLLDTLRKSKKSSAELRRELVQAGLDPAQLGVKDMREQDYQDLLAQGGKAGSAAGSLRAAAAHNAAQKAKLEAQTDTAMTPIKKKAIEAQTAINEVGSDTLSGKTFSDTGVQSAYGADTAFAKASPRARRALERYQKSHAPGVNLPPVVMQPNSQQSLDAHTKALEAHTKAMEKHGQMLRMPGEYGNVSRQGALPTGLGGQSLLHALHDHNTIRLSGF